MGTSQAADSVERRRCWLLRWLFPLSRRYRRLEGEIRAFRSDLGARLAQHKREKGEEFHLASLAYQLADQAEGALRDRDIQTGWVHLHAAQRVAIELLKPGEQEAMAEAVRKEVEVKLAPGGWRRKAIEGLLGAEGRGPTPVERLSQAVQIRDEEYDNQYFKMELLRDQLKGLCALLFLCLCAVFALFFYGAVPETMPAETFDWRLLAAVALFGLLGGTISAILSVAGTSSESRIPQRIADRSITLSRALMGAGSAVIVYMFVVGGFLPFQLKSTATVLAIAAASGVSERLLTRAVEGVVAKDAQKGK